MPNHIAGMTFVMGALLTLAPPTLLPQQQPRKPAEDLPPPITVDVDVVNVLASVRDKRGALVSTLAKDDFIVTEDGKPQEIRYFDRETDLPLTIGLLVDVSRSQRNLIEVEKSAAYQFFTQVLRKKDMAFLISFGEDAELLQDFTGSPRLLETGLDRLRVNAPVSGVHPGPVPTVYKPRGTVLYEAVYLAANDKLAGEVGRKVIVMITDGVDMGSRVTRDKAIEAAQKSDAVVYSIYYVDRGAYDGFGYGSDSDLKKMSEQTGGRVFRVDRKHTLNDIFTELQQEMRSQYAIGYTPTNAVKDGSFRKLDVRARDKDLKVQARAGYYAVRPEPR
ncbi:MAG TPA: VWA domain-containing protein [Bryobacteraceae bacterium]|nr:VWA domain-containing protein [Bryobacteraceae bacterium]